MNVCIPVLFHFVTSINPGADWSQKMCDSMNVIMLKNNAEISFYPSESGLTINFYDDKNVWAHGKGYTGDRVDMFNQVHAGYYPYKLLLHEIMHVFGLPHTFGFCGIYETGELCDDGFSDTPNEAGHCADTCSRNIMGYNPFQDYVSPMQIQAVHHHFKTDSLYRDGLYLPAFGMSVSQFIGECGNMSISTHNLIPVYPVQYFDFYGREIPGAINGFYWVLYSDGSVRKFYTNNIQQ